MATPQPQALEVVVPPEHQTGVYANLAAVSSQTPHDITLDFIQMIPGAVTPTPVVVARLKLAPTFLMPLMQVLSSHLAQHEAFQQQAEQQHPPDPEEDE